MDTIQLSTETLEWAASRKGKTLADYARSFSSKKTIENILQGVLTYSQAVDFAGKTGVSLGDLFLETPPAKRKLSIADFRTIQDSDPLSADFFEVLDDIEFKKDWYKEHLIANGVEKLDFVGKYKKSTVNPSYIAQNMRETLGFSNGDLFHLSKPENLFSLLSSKCEELGILVFKNGVVGNSTKRTLSVSEFRGFALADEIVPIIFINGADAPAAWVFTLAHELAHIWLGNSGVSDTGLKAENAVENLCNKIAAEFLVPEDDFITLWNNGIDCEVYQKLDNARKAFKVSLLVVARRAFEIGLISKEKYTEMYNNEKNKKKASTGGDFYSTLAVRNSKKFSTKIANLAISGKISLGQAGRLLNTNPNSVVKFYDRQNTVSI